jgi:hypothetical protein
MMKELEQAGMTKLYTEMELPLSSVLFDMERVGFRVDEDILKELQTRFNEQSEALAKQIYSLTGETFNILSPKQLGEVLFVSSGCRPGERINPAFQRMRHARKPARPPSRNSDDTGIPLYHEAQEHVCRRIARRTKRKGRKGAHAV